MRAGVGVRRREGGREQGGKGMKGRELAEEDAASSQQQQPKQGQITKNKSELSSISASLSGDISLTKS